MHVFAREIIGVFAHIERADQDRPCRLQTLDQCGIPRGRCSRAVDLRTGAGRHTCDIEQIFHRERYARERPCHFACGYKLVDIERPRPGTFTHDISKGIQLRIDGSNTLQGRLDDAGGLALAA